MAKQPNSNVPKQIKEMHLTILNIVIASGVNEVKPKDIHNEMPETHATTVNAHIREMEILGLLASVKRGVSKFISVTDMGAKVWEQSDSLEIIPTTTRGKRKKVESAPQLEAVKPVPRPLNLSETADTLITHMAQVAQENHAYREFIAETAQRCAEFLGLELVKLKSDQTN